MAKVAKVGHRILILCRAADLFSVYIHHQVCAGLKCGSEAAINAVRPIGVGKVLRRIMAKCVMKILKHDVIDAINISTEGHQHQGALLGSRKHLEDFVEEKVEDWISQIVRLAEFAQSHPQASYV